MKKILVLTLILIFALTTSVLALDVKFQMSAAFAQRVVDAFEGLERIPMIENPAYVDEETTPDEPRMIPQYTSAKWARICIKRHILRQVKKWENRVAMDEAREGVIVDDSEITDITE